MPRETKGKAGNTRKAGRGVIKGLVGLAKRRGDRESERIDPPPAIPRVCKIAGKQEEVLAGQWPGAPCDQLPPGCPIVPLGRDGTVSYFVDTEGQLKSVSRSEWGKRAVIDLFALTPNYAEWAWPRFGAARGEEEIPKINGLAADEAERCLVKAAASRGLFSPHDSVRGRGAWIDSYGRLIWHSGDRLWRIEGGKLKDSSPGEINDVFYPAKPKTVAPWPEPVPAGESPAQDIFAALQSWKWGRQLDPVLVLGGIGVMMVCGALEWRPHLFISGDKGVGKSELQRLIKGVLGRVLFKVAQPSEAGVRQHLGLDALPVAVDEMEGSADNRQVSKVIELACVASSGDLIARGGADHKGVLFQARSSFLLSGINPPSMRPQDRSRFAMIDLGQLGDVGEPPEIDRYAGPMLLRAIMDAWSDFERALADWKTNLKEAGFDQRAADTYGTLGAMAELMLGPEALDDAGIPITEAARLGALVAEATATERAEQTENWRACLEHLLGSVVDAWKGGEKPTVGSILEELEGDDPNVSYIKSRLGSAGLNLWSEKKYLGPYFLAVPKNLPALARLFAGSRWQDGGWWHALRQGVASGIVRDPGKEGGKPIKISRVTTRCLLIDLDEYARQYPGDD